ncbi:uncharacterized protein LOC126905181 [Daktulosphaira vitifoliae]|uniref:uncharacterized protein LOC126905181 n=1 Tax=Daktulosphaira vitifoliae TaxID=58002 RepID=UPI0021A9BF2C|nr:uncharacterized protein LOC126905181 [Daktulosphaira vitifoliae]XP_050540623.1 uncharacterized protein LOC126905181 [Daktulosphaira vitifoliae]XP_050540624.1 uncharacterized protein LOC126905181 [Daktulosphaira vitifoliae]XP_050540625.1 uncharacterized protein LOC126905181 [Daktulosphaira vitifoliae]
MNIYYCLYSVLIVWFLLTLDTTQADSGTSVKGRVDHCNKTVDIYEDITSPEVTPFNIGKPLYCSYRFRSFKGTPKDYILRIRFKKFKFGVLVNGTYCQGGFMQILDYSGKGNIAVTTSKKDGLGSFCGEIEQPQTFLSETSSVRVIFQTDNYTDQTYYSFDSRAEQETQVYLRYGQHPELYPNRRGILSPGTYCDRTFKECRLQTCYVQSPAYPGVYPRNLRCNYWLNTKNPFIKLYIQNEEFNVDGQRCENIITCPMRPITSGAEYCPYDYIKIYDGQNASSPEIGTFCGMGKFPHSIVGTSEDLFVEFVTSPAGPLLNTGFHFNVGNMPGHVQTAGKKSGACDWILSSEHLVGGHHTEGIFMSIAHWYPPHTSCTYHIIGLPQQIVRVYFPSFRVNSIESPVTSDWNGDCGESLTLYDAAGPDDTKIIKTFCDTFSKPAEKHDFVSTGNSMFIRFESKTGSYSGSSLYYWAHYDFFNNTKFGTAVPDTACDEEFVSWKPSSGYLRSPVNTLVYKRQGSSVDFDSKSHPIICRYRFTTDTRLYARVVLRIESIRFKAHAYKTPLEKDNNCWYSERDKLLVWEPDDGDEGFNLSTIGRLASHKKDDGLCLYENFNKSSISSNTLKQGIKYVSTGNTLNVELSVNAEFAATSYFKDESPLFEARYEFVHGPLCGPSIIQPVEEGQLIFPRYDAMGFMEPPNNLECIWEIRVHDEKDLWLHFDQVKFIAEECADGRLEIYLPSLSLEKPFMSVCGHNVSKLLKSQPIMLTAKDLESVKVSRGDSGHNRYVQIRFFGSSYPHKTEFKIVWTELAHKSRNIDSALAATAANLQDSCSFFCPEDKSVCLPDRLVCNGVVNCPGSISYNDESKEVCDQRNLKLFFPIHVTSTTLLFVITSSLVIFFIVLSIAISCRRRRSTIRTFD